MIMMIIILKEITGILSLALKSGKKLPNICRLLILIYWSSFKARKFTPAFLRPECLCVFASIQEFIHAYIAFHV